MFDGCKGESSGFGLELTTFDGGCAGVACCFVDFAGLSGTMSSAAGLEVISASSYRSLKIPVAHLFDDFVSSCLPGAVCCCLGSLTPLVPIVISLGGAIAGISSFRCRTGVEADEACLDLL